MEELISIIVPVYNVERYLPKCLDSLGGQTHRNLEIILVDDGSTDNSGRICEKYAGKDRRFRVIHQNNKGVLAARNRGIGEASGSYIGFVDSDDWVDCDAYEKLYQELILARAEVILCRKYIYDENLGYSYEEKSVLKEGVYPDCRSKDIQETLFLGKDEIGGLSLNLYDKLFKKELVLRNYKAVDIRLHYFEDMALSLLCLLQADRIAVCNRPLYYYRQREGSLCHRTDDGYLEQLNIFYRSVRPAVARYSEAILERLDTFIAERAVYGVNHMMGLNLRHKIPFYVPPFIQIPAEDSVILYGAGEIGRSYYQIFCMARPGQIVRWVDRQYIRLREEGLPVDGVSSITEESFDRILIAVKFENNAESIKKELIDMGIPADRMIWEKPVMLIHSE